MSVAEMLSLQLTLDTHPGSVPPTLHLKQGASSLSLTVYFETDGLAINDSRACIVKGTRPDGSELYITTTSLGGTGVFLTSASMRKMAEVAGKYLVEITIFDARSGITRRNASLHDTLTTAKFYVNVENSAYREEEA